MDGEPTVPTDSPTEAALLRQQIGALQQRVAALEAELVQERAVLRPGETLARTALLLMAAALALLPPVLVVHDRWLGHPEVPGWLQNAWCRTGPLCRSAYPAYFLVILPALLACALVVWLLCRRLPADWLLPLETWSQPGGGADFKRPAARKATEVVATNRPGARANAIVPRAQFWIAWAVIAAAAASLGLLAWQAIRRNSIPGWEFALAYLLLLAGWLLREIPGGAVRAGWRHRGRALVGVALAAVALLLTLASLYGARQFQWITVLGLLLAGVNLWRIRREVSPIFWIGLLALALFATNMNAWWLSAIGDEYSFWAYARQIVEQQPLAFIADHVFVGQAVYEAHPYLSSLIQAGFMKLFGGSGFGWRVSNACLSAAAILLFFGFFRAFVQRRTALMAALFLAMSHYLMSFGKIGYNNLQAFFAEAAVLAGAAWAVRSRRWAAFVLLGTAMGLCFYVYPAALYVLPLPLLLLLFYAPPVSRRMLGRWLALVVSLLIPVFPLLLQPGYWQAKVAGTLWYNPALTRTAGDALANVARNLIYSTLSFLFVPQEDHFIAVAYVDPLTAALVSLGLAAVCYLALRRQRFAWCLLLAFAALLLVVGASHDRPYPTGTRMFLLLPWFALFAAAGLTWLLALLQGIGLRPRVGMALCAAIFVAALGLNLYQAYPLARDRMAGFQSLENLTFRIIQRAQPEESTAPKTYVFITSPAWSVAGFRLMPEVYPIQARFAEVVVTEPILPESANGLITDGNALVIIEPWLDPAWQQALEPALRSLGKASCPIRATNGDQRFVLWYTPGLERFCGEQ